MPFSDPSAPHLPGELPLVGRSDDLEELHTLFGDPSAVEPMIVLTGEGGVGKSRLARTLAGEARRRDWRVMVGRAYPVETGVPYALLSDAFLPVLREMDEATLAVLTRGTQSELRRLFPALGDAEESRFPGEDPRELQTRLYWNFTAFVQRFGQRDPLLLVLEDVHWADASSIALLHFLVRHLDDDPVRILCTYNTDYRGENPGLVKLERSLVSMRRMRLRPLAPLSRDNTGELLEEVFEVEGPAVRDFADLLFGWTRGNPYFLEQTLDALVASGRLYERDGTWLGWEARELELPSTIRDAVLVRMSEVSDDAMAVAELLSVVGSRTRIALLEEIAELPGTRLIRAIEELVRPGLVEEQDEDGSILLQFRHPLTRETLYQRLSLSRRRMLHGRVAEGLERIYGGRAMRHADELAYHFSEAGAPVEDTRAALYLAEAGRAALKRHADREAADYLDAAVTRLVPPEHRDDEAGDEREPPGPAPPPDVASLKRELARARTRLGQYEEASAIWTGLLERAEEAGDAQAAAQANRHLGLIAFWTGAHDGALERYEAALDALGDRAPSLRARLHIAAGLVDQELGRAGAAQERIGHALDLGEELEDAALLARVHRALALLFIFTGQAKRAREHGWRAVELADRAHDQNVAFWGRWALASLEGLSGGPGAMERLMDEARGVAEELRSPVLRLWITELEVQHAYYSGDWDRALTVGERGVTQAENLNQRTLLVRLLVWTATTYLGRGDVERGREMIERAWTLAGLDRGAGGDGSDEDGGSGTGGRSRDDDGNAEGAGGGEDDGRGAEDVTGPGRRPRDVHAIVPAYIGRTALLMAEEKYEAAIEVGEKGLAIADRSGYVIWVLHRLLPLVGEAYVRAERLDGAKRAGERLRREGTRMDHRLALAWASAAEAVVAWHSGRIEEAASLLRSAAEGMEEIGVIREAARLRRQLAGRLADLDDREGSLQELRKVHEVFGQLGARPEFDKAREQFREVGARPPSRSEAEGTADLTPREAEVASLVADRKSNKAVAKELGVSPRTVTTHLSNIYRKLDIGSRGELVDMVREGRVAVVPRAGERG